MKTYAEIRDWLENFIPQVWGKEGLGLARIEELLGRLGNPEKKFKSVHVAGTSGKGSTAFYIARLLQESESQRVKVGLHVSPHLSYIGERMQINGKVIEEIRLIRLISRIRPIVEQIQREKPGLTPSYFEILVAASFLYFAQEKVDIAVVEVGLGGRLDATNVLTPEVSVITNIGLDHTDILGKTVEKIAWEKAGIIKQGVPVVTAAKGKALAVIRKVAKGKGSHLVQITNTKYPIPNNQYYTRETEQLAIKTIETFGFRPTKEQIEKAFSVGFPGRFEEIMPGVILDGAHNPDKVRALIEFIKHRHSGERSDSRIRQGKDSGYIEPYGPRPSDSGPKARMTRITLVLAFKKGKDWKKMVDLLVKEFQISNFKFQIIATEFQAVTDTGKFAAVPSGEIVAYVLSMVDRRSTIVRTISNSQEAVFYAISHLPLAISKTKSEKPKAKSVVIVTGSLYLVGEARAMWQ